MSRGIDFIKNKILASGTDDWVHEAEACYAARQAVFGDRLREGFPEDETLGTERLAALRADWTAAQERQAFPLALEAIKELLRDGLIEIGSVTKDGFVRWGGSSVELESRIDRLLEMTHYPLMPGDLFWLSNTSLGDEKAGAPATP